MKPSTKINGWLVIFICFQFGLTTCSTMSIKKYPEPSDNLFDNSNEIEGVSLYAKPLSDKNEFIDYFGVNLSEQKILAVYLSVKNNNSNVSYTIPAESIYLSQIVTEDHIYSPDQGEQDVGEAFSVIGTLLISPILWSIGDQQLSDASIIKENFESKKFRTKTIDPGKTASGFCYFNTEDYIEKNLEDVCIIAVDPISDNSFPICQKINL